MYFHEYLSSDFEIKAPEVKNIFGNEADGEIQFFPRCVDGVCTLDSQSLKVESQGLEDFGFTKEGIDVNCPLSCNQLKINKIWVSMSNNGWETEGWTNTDDPEGTGDHEPYE